MSDSSTEREIEEINTTYYHDGRTDGLPIVPPTEERVNEMLRGTDLPQDHLLGKMGNREGKLTVSKLAINAVMAGCCPLHMPVLVAGAEALADPDSNSVQISVSTGSWAYLWLINGPIREYLDLRSDTGAFGPKFRSNRCIGRALGFAYDNTALIHPGEKDMGVQGNPFKHSLVAGENEESSPFSPFHVSAGFDADQSTISFFSPESFVQHYTFETDARGVLKGLILGTPRSMSAADVESRKHRIIYSIAPYNAEHLADAGMTKQDVKEYLYENSHVCYGEHLMTDTKKKFGEDAGVKPFEIPQFESPGQIEIVVTGGAGRVNAVMGDAANKRVTKPISLPDNWEELLEEYQSFITRDWGSRTT